MNIPLQFTWRFDQIPSIETLEQRSSLSKELLTEHLDQPVPPFVATLPMYLAETIQRPFPGGTILSFLQFLYDVYQEPMPADECIPILNYPQTHVVERFRTYIDQAQNGIFAPRSTMLYPNTILTRIRRNKLVIHWD
jgi:hypothetical protein